MLAIYVDRSMYGDLRLFDINSQSSDHHIFKHSKLKYHLLSYCLNTGFYMLIHMCMLSQRDQYHSLSHQHM